MTMRSAGPLLALLFVALAASADAPSSGPAPAGAPAAVPASDDEIRKAFVGRAACPPQPWPVGVGPHEFRANGDYARARDLASAFGRYAVADGRICITLAGSHTPDYCFAVLRRDGAWLFRLDEAAAPPRPHAPTPVTPCPLP